jgi:hypothetical protein
MADERRSAAQFGEALRLGKHRQEVVEGALGTCQLAAASPHPSPVEPQGGDAPARQTLGELPQWRKANISIVAIAVGKPPGRGEYRTARRLLGYEQFAAQDGSFQREFKGVRFEHLGQGCYSRLTP